MREARPNPVLQARAARAASERNSRAFLPAAGRFFALVAQARECLRIFKPGRREQCVFFSAGRFVWNCPVGNGIVFHAFCAGRGCFVRR